MTLAARMRASVALEDDAIGHFGDRRLDKTAALMGRQMEKLQSTSVRRLAQGSRSIEIAFSRLLGHDSFSVEELVKTAAKSSVAAIGTCRHVLLLQDTSELSFDDKKNPKRRGLGQINDNHGLGFYLHPVLAIEADTAACLGIMALHCWSQDVDKKIDHNAQRRGPIENRKSIRWIDTPRKAIELVADDKIVTVIADRESDIYEEFDRLPDHRTHLITRSSSDRYLANGDKLFATADGLPVANIYKIELPEISQKRKARTACLELRFSQVEIKRPKNCSDKKARQSLHLYMVDVREIGEIDDEKTRIHWRLLTTHKVESIQEAMQIVGWYKQRWHIEQLFRTLKKQGLDIESSQVESYERLVKLAAMALVTATKSLQLTLARQGKTTRDATDVFPSDDHELLERLDKHYEGSTEKSKNPHPKGSLAWASWLIARLGGWGGYAKARPPGPITMRRGLEQFATMRMAWTLARDM